MDRMSGNVYVYTALSDASKQIRILNILPDNDPDPIRITLNPVNLDDVAGGFDALSYTWGSEDKLQSALIDGKSILIRYNLWSFLQHQRSLGNVNTPLWIDAVCINQQNVPEKNVQVARMGDFYRAAGRVLIWLGEASNPSTPHKLNKSQMMDSWMRMSREPNQFFLDRMEGRELTRPLLEEDAETLSLLDQAMSIVYNPYWKRMWIVQEALLASSLRIILGSELLDEGCIDMIWTVVSTEPEELYRRWVDARGDSKVNLNHLEVSTLQNSPMLWVVIENAGKVYQPDEEQHNQHSTFDFGSMLHFFGKSLCFDRRDRVYSLLGLTQATKKVRVDYACTLEELCADALECLGEEDYSGVSFTQIQTLVQALGVTRKSCLDAFDNLPQCRAQSLGEMRIDMGINVFGILTAECASNDDDSSDCKRTTIYLSQARPGLFLSTDFREDGSVLDSWHASNREILLLCSLGGWPLMLLERNESKRLTVTNIVELYQLPDRDNVEHEAYRVRPCPSEIKDLLSQRLNIPRLDWNALCRGKKFEIRDAFISFSLLEIMHLYEMFSVRSGRTRQQDEAIYL